MLDLSGWTGGEEHQDDVVDAGLTARFINSLDTPPNSGSLAPQGLHWCLAAPAIATAQLDKDGHPARGKSSLLPPVPLPRRMWASSEVMFLSPLHIGENVRRTSRVTEVKEKAGTSGALVFVVIDHVWAGDGGGSLRERQTIVYREPAGEAAPPAPPPLGPNRFRPEPEAIHRVVMPTEALLFRYSALTFNSHRIHYDLPYAVGVERYRGLVVQGPLMATLLLDLAYRTYGDQPLTRFAFRGLSPAVAGEPLHLVLKQNDNRCEFGVYADDGRQVMSAEGAR